MNAFSVATCRVTSRSMAVLRCDGDNLDRFRELCSGLTRQHYPDADHLWTAEANNLDYFLTADRAFINVMTLTRRLALRSKLISPRDLLAELGGTQLDRLPITDDKFHPL
jgi:hypothetical protein